MSDIKIHAALQDRPVACGLGFRIMPTDLRPADRIFPTVDLKLSAAKIDRFERRNVFNRILMQDLPYLKWYLM